MPWTQYPSNFTDIYVFYVHNYKIIGRNLNAMVNIECILLDGLKFGMIWVLATLLHIIITDQYVTKSDSSNSSDILLIRRQGIITFNKNKNNTHQKYADNLLVKTQ